MAEHLVLAEPFAELMGDALRQLAGVDEDQRALVPADQFDQPFVDLGPVFVGADRLELLARHFDGEVHVADVADVHHGGWCPGCTD